MSDYIRHSEATEDPAQALDQAPAESPPTWRRGVAGALRILQVRLRLLGIIAVAFLVVGNWEYLRTWFDRLTSSGSGEAPQAVSSNTEYFCPMDPGVLSDWPAKCPICNMSLVRREKGGTAQLPEGVESRMQYSPYRLQLAGVRDATAACRPLVRQLMAYGKLSVNEAGKFAITAAVSGTVAQLDVTSTNSRVEQGQALGTLTPEVPTDGLRREDLVIRAPATGVIIDRRINVGDHVEAGSLLGMVADLSTLSTTIVVPAADAAFLKTGQAARVTRPEAPGQGPWDAKVVALNSDSNQGSFGVEVQIEVLNPNGELQAGMELAIELSIPLADVPPFASQPTGIEALQPGELRKVFACPNHNDAVSARAGKCPLDGVELVAYSLADNQRVRYSCPHHPEVVANKAEQICDACQEELRVRVLTYRPKGQVLAIPLSAVVDTGMGSLVYVNRGHGMYDGVRVELGSSADGYVAIIDGLRAGEEVAAAGAFLLDAETRLSANAATAYFGATRNPAVKADDEAGGFGPSQPPGHSKHDTAIDEALRQLAPDDEALARRQRECPVSRLPLGSMGKPIRIAVGDQVVFLCCESCSKKLLADPDKYLAPAAAPGTR